MADYFVRVEFINPNANDYYNLDIEMDRNGFLTTVQDAIGTNYDLPTAEYFLAGSSNDNLDSVHQTTMDIVNNINASGVLIVTEANNYKFSLNQTGASNNP
jgi:hypothetical protein